MKKKFLTLCVSAAFAISCFSQADSSALDTVSAGSGENQSKAVVLNEFDTPLLYSGNSTFYYKGKNVQKYSFGFYNEPDEVFSVDNYKLWMSGNGGMKFFTNGQPRLTITKDGYFGVGTTIPKQMLHIVGGNILISRTSSNAKADGSANGSILFGAETSTSNPYGAWGIEYLDESHTGPGLNFWKTRGFNYALFLHDNGNVGIGTNKPLYKLDVMGSVRCQELVINMNGASGADFVFAPGYNLAPLSEVEEFVRQNRHLPNIPAEKEMQQNGLSVQEFQIQLLRKVEELTLYVIEQGKDIKSLEMENELLKQQLLELTNK